ncbi:MAG: undecaprenyl-diphosphate phosphatase [Bacteroidota bacterium]
MSMLQAIILGAVQGLTEFLPVSSSGHLVLAEHLLGVPVNDDITFEVFVHFGTLLSVLAALWPEVKEIGRAMVSGLTNLNLVPTYYRENEYFRIVPLIVVASVPAAIVGLIFEEQVAAAFTDPKLVAVMLVITGLILFLTQLVEPPGQKRVGIISGLVIGIAQAFAIIPGISRSGSTISTGLYLGITPLKAARFSFLMSVPVIAGATLLKTIGIVREGVSMEGIAPILLGTVIAFVSGYIAIKFLFTIIEKGRLSVFSFYCLTVGTLGIVFL